MQGRRAQSQSGLCTARTASGSSERPRPEIDTIAYDGPVLFAELAAVSAEVGATRSRSAKIRMLAECLRTLADDVEPDALAAGVCFLAGRVRQGRLGVGHAAAGRLREVTAAAEASLTVGGVDRALAEFERQRPRRADRLQPLVPGRPRTSATICCGS